MGYSITNLSAQVRPYLRRPQPEGQGWKHLVLEDGFLFPLCYGWVLITERVSVFLDQWYLAWNFELPFYTTGFHILTENEKGYTYPMYKRDKDGKPLKTIRQIATVVVEYRRARLVVNDPGYASPVIVADEIMVPREANKHLFKR